MLHAQWRRSALHDADMPVVRVVRVVRAVPAVPAVPAVQAVPPVLVLPVRQP